MPRVRQELLGTRIRKAHQVLIATRIRHNPRSPLRFSLCFTPPQPASSNPREKAPCGPIWPSGSGGNPRGPGFVPWLCHWNVRPFAVQTIPVSGTVASREIVELDVPGGEWASY